MKNVLLLVLVFVMLGFFAIFGIDREVARRDYADGNEATNCIFKMNCDHFNNLLD